MGGDPVMLSYVFSAIAISASAASMVITYRDHRRTKRSFDECVQIYADIEKQRREREQG